MVFVSTCSREMSVRDAFYNVGNQLVLIGGAGDNGRDNSG